MLLSSPNFSEMKSSLVPICGPYHCSHAYSESDVEQILVSALDRVKFLDLKTHNPNISCTSGDIISESTFGALLRGFVNDILVQQMRTDHVVDSLSKITLIGKLIPVNTKVLPSLAAALTRKGKNVQIEKALPAPSQSDAGLESSKIAIVGFSGRFPEADGLSQFWNILQKGLDVHKPIPDDRFDREAHYDPTGKRKNTSKIKHGCWISEPGLFDARFFHLSPREACQADPAQRLALLTAYEALEMAGFVADRTASTQKHRVGVFYGATSDDWREVNSGQVKLK